ncbi:MAG: hypothetical protein KGL39_04995 [Patescibacteria group bacterium]|nr:hypothetical protein [Patescibacteria group bacterium]
MIFTLPIPTRERLVLRLLEAQSAKNGVLPSKIVVGVKEYEKVKFDMRRYGFHNRPLHIMGIPIEAGDIDRSVVKFEWRE